MDILPHSPSDYGPTKEEFTRKPWVHSWKWPSFRYLEGFAWRRPRVGYLRNACEVQKNVRFGSQTGVWVGLPRERQAVQAEEKTLGQPSVTPLVGAEPGWGQPQEQEYQEDTGPWKSSKKRASRSGWRGWQVWQRAQASTDADSKVPRI